MTPDPARAELLRAIHDEHSQALLRYVLRLTRGDTPFAEDVVQEALLRLWRKPEILQQPGDAARAWLFTVARNLVIDDRRSARFSRELQTDDLPERPSLDAIGPAVDKWVLAEALKSLSADHRTAIVRAYYFGQTVADIAAHERIAPGTVKSRLHYGLRALRMALQERGVVQ
ncbi:RNA polymerase subunit sigma [Mycolicibacterium acapulense]|uniref:RNA polymerase subunit sigma n=1 Tax=Mycobacterium lehmannii TaxID=2048550 RepID=A0A101A5T8_9MYCO|nr:sigma-70 family RNA polymerase sigma factor [Mycobacterium lehmannii]KUH96822.1 RNA polymerase subunit sigma [Mycolicibacterium acapulense]KUI07915.1 RNA polymerase subunit sigma [Mycolicibacterium acapulense]KUI08324.1 RNA polymerase subunit sigma [Mycolicibacterium acapulense]KUI14370.1 RNA polymerase subunit sigma [Mycobacterium lehmannii]